MDNETRSQYSAKIEALEDQADATRALARAENRKAVALERIASILEDLAQKNIDTQEIVKLIGETKA